MSTIELRHALKAIQDKIDAFDPKVTHREPSQVLMSYPMKLQNRRYGDR